MRLNRPDLRDWRNWFTWLVHLAALLPLAWLFYDGLTDNLTVNPIQALTQRTGQAAILLLIASLACTPLDSLLRFRPALRVRRALGLYAFGYAALHLLIFVGLDFGFDLGLIWQGVVEKKFVAAGLGAFLILLPLAITSFRWWQQRLGKNWKRLHQLVYLAGLLAVTHYIWLVKSDIRQPLAYGLVVVLLLLARTQAVKRLAVRLRAR